jgi:hypothetical protein
MNEKPSDPTKEPEFQKVVRHFVTTPHKPHKPLKKRDPDEKTDKDAVNHPDDKTETAK